MSIVLKIILIKIIYKVIIDAGKGSCETLSVNYTPDIRELCSKSTVLKEGGRFNELNDMDSVKYVVFVGSSVCGKSTILDFIRKRLALDSGGGQSLVYKKVDTYLPERFINRERRESPDGEQNDLEDLENRYCSAEEYMEFLKNGKIGINWERKLAGKTSKYGFTSLKDIQMEEKGFYQLLKSISQECATIPVHITDPRALVLLSGNNAFYSNSETINGFPDSEMKKVLVIGVYASEDIRIKRIQTRSPNMNKIEALARLKDSAANMIPNTHLYIDTTGGGDTPNIDMYDLMRLLSDKNMGREKTIGSEVNQSIVEIL